MTSHRTVVLVGPPGSGKTELAHALAGPARLDGPLAWHVVTHGGTTLHLLDAPGDPFLAGALLAGLHAADLVLFVLSAGADARTVQLWEQCEGRPRVVAVTGLDRAGADFDESVALCQRLLGEQVHPLSLPLHGDAPDEAVEGVLDLLTQRLFDSSTGHRVERDPDPQHLPLIESLRSELVEAVLAGAPDGSLLDAYLDEDLVPADVVSLLREAVKAGAVQPVLPVSPRAGVGLVELLDVLAASGRFEPPVVHGPDGSSAEPLEGTPDGPHVAQVLQVTDDGALVRVLSGRQDEPPATAGEVTLLTDRTVRPGHTLSPSALVVEPWHLPEPQHPVALRAGTSPSHDLAELHERVERDGVARLHLGRQLVLWSLGPPHATSLLSGLDLELEPVEADASTRTVVEIRVPRAFLRTVVSDLSGRGAAVRSAASGPDGTSDELEHAELVTAELSDLELVGYSVALSSLSHGTATFVRLPTAAS